MLIWPGSNGTFETFAEAMDFGALYAELRKRDAKMAAEPEDFEPAKEYFRSVAPKTRYKAPTGMWPGSDPVGKDGPDESIRFRMKLDAREVGPHQWGQAPRIEDTQAKAVLLDLWGTSWDVAKLEGVIADAGADEEDQDDEEGEAIYLEPAWSMDLRHYPEGNRYLSLRVNGKERTATVGDEGKPMPLDFVQRCLKNYSLHERWEWLTRMLAEGPKKPEDPLRWEAVPAKGDERGRYVVEIWPGAYDQDLPFLQIRVLGAGPGNGVEGRVLLDMRGSNWTADFQVMEAEPKLAMQFVCGDEDEKYEAAKYRLMLDLPSRRVTCDDLEGSTSIGVLHSIVQKARAADWFCEEVEEAFARGRGVPLP